MAGMNGIIRYSPPGILLIVLSIFLLTGAMGGCSAPEISSNTPITPSQDGYKLILNGQQSTIPSSQIYERNGRLMMAVRPALEQLGVQTYWDNDYHQLYMVYQEHNASFYANSTYYTVDTLENVMDTPSEMSGNEIILPVDLCFGTMGAEVAWDKAGQTLSIVLPPAPDTSTIQKLARTGVSISTRVIESSTVEQVLASQCSVQKLPAMGGAIVWDDGRIYLATTGVRKNDDPTPVTNSDLWHMGSCSKAMTAAMIACLEEQGVLRWDSTMAEAFPEYLPEMDADHRAISLEQLLTHTAGLPREFDSAQFARDFQPGMSAIDCRLLLARQAAVGSLEYPPGRGYGYSNLGYIVAGSMAERATGARWEDLMSELLFKPLGVTEVSYAGTGTVGKVDQPWPHDWDRQPMATNGPFGDPLAMFSGPCGSVHISLEDWGRFIIDQLRGIQGKPALLNPESYQRLMTPSFANPEYAHGWMLIGTGTDGGTIYAHSGTNCLNTCSVKMYPSRGYAVLVTTNAGDSWDLPLEKYEHIYMVCEQTADQLASVAESGKY